MSKAKKKPTLFDIYQTHEVVVPTGYKAIGFLDLGNFQNEVLGLNSCDPKLVMNYSANSGGYRIIVKESPGTPESIFRESEVVPVPKSNSWFDALPEFKIEVGCKKSGPGSASYAENGITKKT